MNLTKIVTVGSVAVGLVCSAGYIQASDSIISSPALLMAQGSSGTGGSNSGLFGSTPDLNSPGGTKDAGKGAGGNTDTAKDRQGSSSGMESGSAGSNTGKSSGGSSSSGPMSGSGSSGDKGKSATGQPSAVGPQGEDKAGGSGPSGPQSLPPGGAPQFEGGKKSK
jgi:hypothetical protein